MSKATLLRIEFEGAAALEQALRDLGNSSAIKKAIRTALMEAAEPAAKMARSLAPRRSGRMAEGVDVSTTLSRRQKRQRKNGRNDPFAVFVYIGARPTGPAVLAEFGTVERHWRNGKSTGAMPARPFMRPAWEAHKFQILADFAKYLWVTIEAEAKRIARRQARLIAKGKSP